MVEKVCEIGSHIFILFYVLKHEHLFMLLHLYPAVPVRMAFSRASVIHLHVRVIMMQCLLGTGCTTAHLGYFQHKFFNHLFMIAKFYNTVYIIIFYSPLTFPVLWCINFKAWQF